MAHIRKLAIIALSGLTLFSTHQALADKSVQTGPVEVIGPDASLSLGGALMGVSNVTPNGATVPTRARYYSSAAAISANEVSSAAGQEDAQSKSPSNPDIGSGAVMGINADAKAGISH